MKDRILAELARIEREHSVRVLLAVESGSRAWGFASPDSDYDVRFVYAPPRDWYLSIAEPRDVIEEMLPGDLDVSGWELRKTLRLFAKCNLALNEWIGSPIVYSEAPGFRQQLMDLLPRFFNSYAGLHHYRSMAVRALEENLRGEVIGIKKLFYVLRPLLACRWISQRRAQPPTLFTDLVVSTGLVSDEEHAWIEGLLALKATALEGDVVPLSASRTAALREELERYKAPPGELAPSKVGASSELDRVLREWALP